MKTIMLKVLSSNYNSASRASPVSSTSSITIASTSSSLPPGRSSISPNTQERVMSSAPSVIAMTHQENWRDLLSLIARNQKPARQTTSTTVMENAAVGPSETNPGL